MRKLMYIANLRLPTEKAYGIQIAKMCEAFSVNGLDVTLVYPYRRSSIKDGIFSYYSVKDNFKVKKIWTPDFYWPGKFDKIAVLIKGLISTFVLCIYALSHKADIIYTRDELPAYFLSFFRKNIVFEAHKFSQKRTSFFNRLKNASIKTVVLSSGLKNQLIKLGYSAADILISFDGVDFDEFDLNLTKTEARNKLSLPQDNVLIGYVGSFTTMGAHKGLDILFRAFDAIKRGDLRLIVVGGSVNPTDEVFYENLATELRINDRVIFVGKVAHGKVPTYLKAIDILTMPTPYTEHFAHYASPLKLFEYMASDRPIISTDLPSVTGVLNDSNSILVKPDSSEEIARGIEKILKLEDMGQKLAQQALIDVKNYTWQKRADNILKFSGR